MLRRIIALAILVPLAASAEVPGPRADRRARTLVERATTAAWTNGVFIMTAPAPRSVLDIKRHTRALAYNLRLRADTVSGYAAALSGQPSTTRQVYALSSYARLMRERPVRSSVLPARGLP